MLGESGDLNSRWDVRGPSSVRRSVTDGVDEFSLALKSVGRLSGGRGAWVQLRRFL